MERNGQDAVRATVGENVTGRPSRRSRSLAAVSYIGFVCLFTFWSSRKDDFVRGHVSQGVVLFLAECGLLILALLLSSTVGRIRIVGFIVVCLFELMATLAAFMLSVVGFVKALLGQDWIMPFLGEYRYRIQRLHWEKG